MRSQLGRFAKTVVWMCGVILCLSAVLGAVDTQDTRLLSDPAVGRDHIAFVYDGDLWSARIDGSDVRRLTSAKGDETSPALSPDGRWVAFSANYDGNVDVYIVPVQGGAPKRLTWHPSSDRVRGFTPDGSAVLFLSARSVFTNRYAQLFTVSIEGGFPQRLPIPNAFRASYSPDGRKMAYTPLSEAFQQWKHYRGGRTSRIWLFDFGDQSVVEIPQPEGRCNDTDPMWLAQGKVYFRSDREGEFNLYSYDVASTKIRRLTRHDDFPVLKAASGGGRIIYEQAGYLHLLTPGRGRAKRLKVGVAAELLERRKRFVGGDRLIRSADLSPSGSRAVFGYRGEIVTVPSKKGDPRNLTRSPGIHERFPAWSPDGTRIAYFSDQSGEYQLHVRSQDGKGDPRVYPLKGAGYYENPVWSPDGEKLAFVDNSLTFYWLDLEEGHQHKVAQEPIYGPVRSRNLGFSWSPDSKWLAYTLNSITYIRTVYLHSLEEGRSHPVSDGLSDVHAPVFDKGSQYLYFFGSTDAGPVNQWFAQSNADMQPTQGIYLAVLRADEPSPLAPESDEEEAQRKPKKPDEKDPSAPADEVPLVDFDGLDQRILALPISVGNYSRLQAGAKGTIYFLEANAGAGARSSRLKSFSLKERKVETVLPSVDGYGLDAKGQKILYLSNRSWYIAPLKGIKPGKGRLNTKAIQVAVDPAAEWEQIFNEAWRINRDYFYATNYHGADWPRMREKYATFLPHLATRSDLNRVLQWMSSELAVGHHRVGGGQRRETADRVAVGLLGADYEIAEGRYRFAKVYGGLNWNPNLRAPLTEPGVQVKAGEYLLEVDGREVRPPANLYSFFENTAGKQLEIRVGPNPDGESSRLVTVRPIRREGGLRNRDWVDGNLKKVEEATGGRVAYVYVPNTAGAGHSYFKRYFFPQADKEAIIVDERFNGGGQVADYYIDLLRRPFVSYWTTRYGADIKTPSASIQGPKVMIINETAGSGGDLLPWMFRKFRLGTLVGRRTWGGLVGILGFPVLMDGGGITAPNLAFWTPEKGYEVENVGVPPDIEVEQTPADVIAGRDPQLEKAIEVILEKLKQHPAKKPQRPPFPVRNRLP